MRQFNDFEKGIINKMIQINNAPGNLNLANILDDELLNKDIYLDYTREVVELRGDLGIYNHTTMISELRDLALIVVTSIYLLEDLQKEGYIIIYQQSLLPSTFRYGQLISGNQSISFPIYDDHVRKFLLNYSLKTIIIGQSLLDFVHNNFRTPTQIQNDRHNRATRIEFGIAILAIALTFIPSIIEIHHHSKEVEYLRQIISKEQTIKLNKQQIDTLTSNMNENKRNIEQIKEDLNEIKNFGVKKDIVKK